MPSLARAGDLATSPEIKKATRASLFHIMAQYECWDLDLRDTEEEGLEVSTAFWTHLFHQAFDLATPPPSGTGSSSTVPPGDKAGSIARLVSALTLPSFLAVRGNGPPAEQPSELRDTDWKGLQKFLSMMME